jgi:hypothetical protein
MRNPPEHHFEKWSFRFSKEMMLKQEAKQVHPWLANAAPA